MASGSRETNVPRDFSSKPLANYSGAIVSGVK